jgi:predicted HTH transcriptional regulator
LAAGSQLIGKALDRQMTIPTWADEQLSHDLPVLRARGEGQEIEFKQEFPQQGSDLAKEIAAFATSNAGTLFIGVKDDGDIVGLEGCAQAEVRDGFLKRLEGICGGAVKPAVTPRVAWAVESEKAVLVITVPKGSEPVYYSQGKGCIPRTCRRGASSVMPASWLD